MFLDTPQPLWVRYLDWITHSTRSKYVMDNKEKFVDNGKKKSLQDRGMIIRFSNKSKVFSR